MRAKSKEENDLQQWKTLVTEEIFNSRWLRLRRDTCRLPNGREIDDYYVVEAPFGAAIVALTEDSELVLVRQYKHGLGKIVLELPAGNVDDDEEPADTIVRELREETGYVASDVKFVATLSTKPARMSAQTFIYFASNVKQEAQQQQKDNEVINIVLMPVKELPSLIKRGDIVTETSLAALLMVWDKLTTL